mgnify:CR=1 FL=1|tara:strand:+ start:645 stop:1001 length:357 start_codon:yes stop_codon:yes gene_type:complete
MVEPIFSSQEHKATLEVYITMCKEFAKDVSSKNKYYNYLDVVSVIFEYHNGYGEGVKENNFYDWLMVIPINLSVATNGFFAGLETQRNRAVIRAYKVVLEEMLQETVDRLSLLETTNE